MNEESRIGIICSNSGEKYVARLGSCQLFLVDSPLSWEIRRNFRGRRELPEKLFGIQFRSRGDDVKAASCNQTHLNVICMTK